MLHSIKRILLVEQYAYMPQIYPDVQRMLALSIIHQIHNKNSNRCHSHSFIIVINFENIINKLYRHLAIILNIYQFMIIVTKYHL